MVNKPKQRKIKKQSFKGWSNSEKLDYLLESLHGMELEVGMITDFARKLRKDFEKGKNKKKVK
jgi:hypothetical protein